MGAMLLQMPTVGETEVGVRVVPGADLAAAGQRDGGVPVMVSLVPPTGTSRTPSDICCVVDVSGSMSSEAMVKTEGGGTAGHGLSVLDIVKHALKTIIRNAEGWDRLALVVYSGEASVIFGLTEMDEYGRRTTEEHLERLQAAGMTNLWDGLKTGFELLQSGHQPGRLQHVMLFTDGLPNINPPRGILPMLKRLKDKEGGRLPCTISTFGFGYELDSELLSQIAIEGGGAYAFIPDAGFVGTVFVNAMSNLLVTMAKDVRVTLEPCNGTKFAGDGVLGGHPVMKKTEGAVSIAAGTLQYGQAKDFVLHLSVPPEAIAAGFLRVTVEYTSRGGGAPVTQTCVGCGPGSPEDAALVEPQRLRLLFVDGVRRAMQALKQSVVDKASGLPLPLEAAQAVVKALAEDMAASPAAGTEAMQALAEDLQGQVSEAFSRNDWYKKWGVHYLPSLMFAHLTQQCNNFKDAGVQFYGGELFQGIRDAADDIFLKLPPPQPSIVRPSPTLAVAAAAPVQAPAVVSMAAYYDPYSGCFDEECHVLMADGTYRKAGEVRKGDVVASLGRERAEVACVVRTLIVDGQLRLVELPTGLRITPHHPVWTADQWRFPAELAPVQERSCQAVCTLLLEEGAYAVVVDGTPCVTLGHGLHEGAAQHPFFGSRTAVLDSLRHLPGFEAGRVELSPGSALRDPETGLVCGFAAVAGPGTR